MSFYKEIRTLYGMGIPKTGAKLRMGPKEADVFQSGEGIEERVMGLS